MQPYFVCTISAALALGCGSATSAIDPPFLRGIITSRAPTVIGVQSGADSIATMFVDGRGIWRASEPCAAQGWFFIGSNTQAFRNGVPVDTSQLVVGQRVTVWVKGIVLESCPPQAGASKVVLEDAQ